MVDGIVKNNQKNWLVFQIARFWKNIWQRNCFCSIL